MSTISNLVFGSVLAGGLTGEGFLLTTVFTLLMGMGLSFVYSRFERCSRSFLVTLSLLPAIVELVILLVNGNIGAGVAVAGAFGLVRFRSAAGSAREITAIFLAMAAGLACGMGYLGVALIFCILVLLGMALLEKVMGGAEMGERSLKITVPEDLDFEGLFEEVIARYTSRYELQTVQTANMGSLYRLHYQIRMNKGASVKELIDELREKNGNLDISLGRVHEREGEL